MNSLFLSPDISTIGILQSLDGGATFTNLTPSFLDPTNPTQRFLDMTYLGGNALLAQSGIIGQPDLSSSEIMTAYSPDLGITWDVQPHNKLVPYGFLAYVGNGVLLLNANESTPDFIEPTHEHWGLFQSTDHGRSWLATSFTVNGHTLSGCSYSYETETRGDDECADNGGGFDLIVWNQVEGEGSVLLANGEVSIYERPFVTLETLCGPWKSTDGGQTWESIPQFSGEPSDILTPCESIALSLAIAPDGRALMVRLNFQGFTTSAYKSTDAGETWEPFTAPDGSPVLGVMYLGNHLESE